MRGAYARFVVGIALSTSLLGLGCGDDTVASPDSPVIDGPVDRPIDAGIDASMPDAAPVISMTVAAVELHGSLPGATPTPAVIAAITTSTSSDQFVNDFSSGGGLSNGCTANFYDVTAGDLPEFAR